jgi:FHA domain-containing protein
MHDQVGHSIGTKAGMRSALAGVHGRLEPADLQRQLIGTSLIDSVLPMNRKAKLWDLYLRHFGAIRDAAQDDFHELFGADFVAANEDQLDRLQPPDVDVGACQTPSDRRTSRFRVPCPTSRSPAAARSVHASATRTT